MNKDKMNNITISTILTLIMIGLIFVGDNGVTPFDYALGYFLICFHLKYKPMTFMQRLGLLIVVLTIAIGGFYLTQWLL